MAHLKRYVMPKWPVPKKAETFVARPRPGPHPLHQSMPLVVMLRDYFSYADTKKEAQHILNQGKVLVDGTVRKDRRFPVGFMDMIAFPDTKKQYRVFLEKKSFVLKETKETTKLCRIQGKSMVKGGKTQFQLHDGRTLISDKAYAVGDTLEISVPDQTIVRHHPLKEGAACLVAGGKNQGVSGKLAAINRRTDMRSTTTAVVTTADGDVETKLDYIMILNKE